MGGDIDEVNSEVWKEGWQDLPLRWTDTVLVILPRTLDASQKYSPLSESESVLTRKRPSLIRLSGISRPSGNRTKDPGLLN